MSYDKLIKLSNIIFKTLIEQLNEYVINHNKLFFFRNYIIYSTFRVQMSAMKNMKLLLSQYNRSYSKCLKDNCDVLVVGGGIVGFATARELLTRNKNLQVTLVEKENGPSVHQTGHNSGVVHAGIYYKPGTMRAKMCIEGLYRTYEYCTQNNIPYKKCGKLIVATKESQIKPLNDLYDRGLENGTPDIRIINGNDIKTIEPFCTVS